MKYPLISLAENAPPGFTFQPGLSQREVRLSAFALFADSVETAEERLKDLTGKIAGVIVTDSNEFVWEMRAPLLCHLGVPPSLRPCLQELLFGPLALLELLRTQADKYKEQSLEFARSQRGHKKLSDDFAISRANLLKEISERKMTEEALRESEEKYRLVVENASDAILIAQEQNIKFVNSMMEIISGYTKDELIKMPFAEIIHPDDRDMVMEKQIKRIRGENVRNTYSFMIMTKSGEIIPVELSGVLVMWQGRPATLNFLRDISQQKKIEEQLQHAQKMEAIGTLAGGVAHDFNNLLMGILGYTSLILLHTEKAHPHYEKLKRIEQQVESGAELTKQLLGFARGGKYEVKATDLNALVKQSSDLFGRTKKEIAIHRKLQPDLYRVEVDRGQIEQVLLNLYVNAWHAMPSGGDLYLETKNIPLDEKFGALYDMRPGSYVRLAVTDTGVGMDEVTQKRIFEPFFTTKELGRGAGLGLASAYGIIRNHGGIINVYSEKGHGTIFTIYLPASEKDIIAEEKQAEKMLTGGETILLVDDEEINTDAVGGLLETLGYTVLIAKNGQDALKLYKKDQKNIHLVILDMIMPGMSGSETFERLAEINPDVKVILSSGYSINGQASKILERGCKGFIQKPFHINEISLKIREVLDA
jgi:two-component system, cell cycle sensor histidine kinase and response regulator CckA